MLTVGTFLADRYEIISKIGAGGMSDVYKAKDHILGRFVAIKVLKPEFSEDRNFVTKFRIEAQSAAGLEHPNIVNIYDVGNEDDLYYIVMEYVEGITLKTYIEKKVQLSFKESASIGIQVARGIEAAHNKNIIHRDIKPQNIIISTEGKVKVTDFGIAKAASSNTISSDVMGSVHYVSPEQARNGFVDAKSDIYSLGIVMFEMVTGRVPFDGDTTVAVAIQHLQEEMALPSTYAPNIPTSFEKIILKCTQKNADRRYQSMGELLNDLRKALANPDDDFVVIAPVADAGKTKVISEEDLKQINENKKVSEEKPAALDLGKNNKVSNKVNNKIDEEIDDEEEEEEDDEAFLNPKVDKIVSIMGIGAAILIVIVVILIVGTISGVFRFGGKDKGADDKNAPTQTESEPLTEKDTESETASDAMVKMIKIVGYSKEDAEKMLEDIGLSMFVVAEVESPEEPGTILSQSINEGEEVSSGSSVSVEVAVESTASDAEYVDVPSVVGRSEDEAKRILTNAGLNYSPNLKYSDTVSKGTVMEQTPQSGKVEKNSTIQIVISRGKEQVNVPNVINKSETNGKSMLKKAGLDYDVQSDYSDDIEEGYIIDQSIAAGKSVDKGTVVTITVSMGKKTVYYKVSKTVSQDGAVSATFTLEGSNGQTYASGSKKLTDGSFTVTAGDMLCSSGTLKVQWTIETIDEEGNVSSEIVETSYDISFEKQ